MSGLAESLDPPVPEEEVKAAEIEQEAPKEPEKPEVGEEPKQEETEAEKPAKTVPLAALHEERERRKELQRQLQAIQNEQAQRFQIMEQRMAQIQQAAHQAPKPPDFNDDPIGNIKAGVDMTQAQIQEIREFQARQEKINERRNYEYQIESLVSGAEQQFAATNEGYFEAVNYLKSARKAQLEAMGYPEDAANQFVANEAFHVAETALRNGRNPAEAAFQMAKLSGWQPKPKQAPQEQKMETLQKGVSAAKSLGSGGTTQGKLTMDQLADMPEDEFDAFMKSGGWKKMGGA